MRSCDRWKWSDIYWSPNTLEWYKTIVLGDTGAVNCLFYYSQCVFGGFNLWMLWMVSEPMARSLRGLF
jgi:hypothetical protein